MSKNKAFILARLLSEKEAKALSEILLAQKKGKQEQLLWSLISNKKPTIEKSVIYKQLYKSTYSKEKDYLLRNELRKLSNSITAFIKQEVGGDYVEFLKFLLERKANTLFEKEITKTIRKTTPAKTETDLQIQKLYFDYWVANSPRKLNALETIQQELLACIKYVSDQKPVYKSNFIVLLSVLERIIWQHFNKETTDLNTLINPTLLEHPNAKYQIEKAFSFQLFGLERIEKLENCSVYLQQCSNEINKNTELSYLQSQLGLEYFLLPDFNKSKPHFEKAYANINMLNKNQKMQLVYNYASLLCAAEDFESANDLLNAYSSIFRSTPFEHNIKLFAIMARINSNQLDGLRDLLPPSQEVMAKDAQVYNRILECIILYYEKEYEVCLSYLENIYNTSRYNSFLDKAFIEFAKLFQRLVASLLLPKSDEKNSKIESCLAASNAFIEAYKLGFGSNMLCSVWLNKTIKANLPSITN